MWGEVLARFEKQAPASVMARIALEQAMPADWIDEVFEANRQRQYPRELLFSTVVELMSLVCLGLRPSLHSAARKMENLPVSLAALYDKIKRTELPLLRALVQGSSERLQPIVAGLGATSCVHGWQLRIVDGNHLPASEKRLAPLRELRGAALPGHSLVVYDPDLAQVVDLMACEEAYESERTGVLPLLDTACSRSRVSATRAPPCWGLPWPCWPTTCCRCSSAASNRRIRSRSRSWRSRRSTWRSMCAVATRACSLRYPRTTGLPAVRKSPRRSCNGCWPWRAALRPVKLPPANADPRPTSPKGGSTVPLPARMFPRGGCSRLQSLKDLERAAAYSLS